MYIWREERYGKGRCVNCGLLGKRSTEFAEKCFYADQKDRSLGVFNEHTTLDGGVTHLSTIPWCFVAKADILSELTSIDAKVHQFLEVRELIEKDRKCADWLPWREFVSPKEHYEEFKMLQLEKERRAFELKLEEINRQERKRTDRVMIWLTIAAILFAAMEVYAALASINPKHWLFDWLR